MATSPTCSSIEKNDGNFSEPCTQWADGEPKEWRHFSCLSLSPNRSYHATYCKKKKGFICQFDPSTLTTNRNITLKLKYKAFHHQKAFSEIEFWLQRRLDSVSETCNGTQDMPGFSIDWITKRGNDRLQNQRFGVNDVLKTMNDWSYNTILFHMTRYLTKWVNLYSVGKARRSNMTNTKIWEIVSRVKKEAIENNDIKCESNMMTTHSFHKVFKRIHESIGPEQPWNKRFNGTNADLSLSFDIFSYMTYCQNEAMGLQIFFENLLRTKNPQTILQATVNTIKLEHEHESTKTALQFLYDELSSIMNLKLPQILTEMRKSTIDGLSPGSSNENLFIGTQGDIGIADMNMATSKLLAKMSNHPVSIYDKQGMISPSALIPFCSFGSKMIGSKVANMTFHVCDIFVPTVFKGGLCYQADAKRSPGQAFFEGKGSGLMLLLDNNKERTIDTSNSEDVNKAYVSEQDIYLGEEELNTENLASIHIGTLAPFQQHGPGDYEMAAIKEIGGTDNFLAWPQQKRGCALEKYEKCQMREFIEKTGECGCSPFQLLPATGIPPPQVIEPILVEM